MLFHLIFYSGKKKKTFLKTKNNLACIMNDSKMCILVAASRLGLLKGWRFSQMICNEFFFKSLVIGFWKQGLLFQDGQNSHGFLKHVNTFLQIHTKIHHSPFDTFKFEINDYKFIVFKQCSILTPDTPHYVPDRQILFKKSLVVLKHLYGSPEVPYTPESHNPLSKKIPIHQICVSRGFCRIFNISLHRVGHFF